MGFNLNVITDVLSQLGSNGIVPIGFTLIVFAFGVWFFAKNSKQFAEVM